MNYETEMSYGATGTEDAIVVQNAPAPVSALQQIALERLAAHRSRKAQAQAERAAKDAKREIQPAVGRQSSRVGASRVRDAVAARYESSVSYREFLAGEAERALEQVQAAAEIAARGAQAAAEEQMRMMQEMQQWSQFNLAESVRAAEAAEQDLVQEAELQAPQLQVRLPEELKAANSILDGPRVVDYGAVPVTDEELAALEDEIEFRLSPDFVGHNLETQAIPANIIEFPRQLVAPRKARPRLAEGPLRDENEPEAQLRIFEVEPEQISVEAAVADPMDAAPEWQSLQLEAATAETSGLPQTPIEFAIEPQTAALHLRMMSALVDGCCIMAALIGFAWVAMRVAGPQLRSLPLPMMGACIAGTLTVMFLLYQMLFFTLAESTPGMRYARIGLCTFGDSNPTRKAMRRRVWAMLLAASPLGLGVIWMALDGEGLGWHDRMTRMYPRAY
jgi:hypothetical protein